MFVLSACQQRMHPQRRGCNHSAEGCIHCSTDDAWVRAPPWLNGHASDPPLDSIELPQEASRSKSAAGDRPECSRRQTRGGAILVESGTGTSGEDDEDGYGGWRRGRRPALAWRDSSPPPPERRSAGVTQRDDQRSGQTEEQTDRRADGREAPPSWVGSCTFSSQEKGGCFAGATLEAPTCMSPMAWTIEPSDAT